MTKVMVFGTFDILHPGHLNLFRQAKRLGDELIVVVARDKTVEEVKGKKPMYDEKSRLKKVQCSVMVNKAVLGREDDKYSLIEEIKPDAICLGYDQDSFTSSLPEELIKRGLKAKIVRVTKYKDYSSSVLKDKHNCESCSN